MFGHSGVRKKRLAGRRRRSIVSAIPHKKQRIDKEGSRRAWFKPGLGGCKVVWLCCCLALLGFSFLHGDKSDHEVVFVYGMIALTFPAGLLVAAGFALFIKGTFQLFQLTVPSCFAFDLLMWPFFIVAGYLQWFVLPKWLVGRYRRRSQ